MSEEKIEALKMQLKEAKLEIGRLTAELGRYKEELSDVKEILQWKKEQVVTLKKMKEELEEALILTERKYEELAKGKPIRYSKASKAGVSDTPSGHSSMELLKEGLERGMFKKH